MDFFEYASIVQNFTNYDTRWVPYLVGGLCFAIVFIFSAVALYTIASREGYRHKWMAFIPFFNTYYIGVCGQKNKIFNLDAKKVAMVTAVLEALLVAGYVLYYASYEILLAGDYITIRMEETVSGIPLATYDVSAPEYLNWAAWCFLNLDTYILWWVQLIYLFLEVLVLSCFFQTFATRRYFLFTLTSVLFPVQGILFFTVRNNTGMNYRDYMRREQERQYRMYQQYNRQNNNPYNNPYNQNPYNQNPYSQGGYNPPPQSDRSTGTSDDDPFSEFGGGNDSGSNGSGGDPFDLN